MTPRYAFSVEMPSFDRIDGVTRVRSEPVSRIRVTGPAPLILVLTRTEDPGVNGILADPFADGADFSSGGVGGNVMVGSRRALGR